MRVMTSGVVHDRMIEWLATAIEEETDSSYGMRRVGQPLAPDYEI